MFRTLPARILTLAALAALAIPASRAAADEANTSAVYQQTLKSTVFIVTEFEGGRACGTGWVVDAERRLVMTNHHVAGVSKIPEAGQVKGIKVYFAKFKNGEMLSTSDEYLRGGDAIPAKLLLTDPTKDLAVIQLARMPAGT